jgi:hygromycin-B 7''-O-kinase
VGALFPVADTPDTFDRIRRDETRLGPGVAAICGRLGLDPAGTRRYPEGTLPVYAVGTGSVLKVYPPCYAEERDREATALDIVDGGLAVPTPRVEATGEIEGWVYLCMTRLPGIPLTEAWPDIPVPDRLRLATRLGEGLAGLHAIRGPRLDALDMDWASFLISQRTGCADRQAKHGLEPGWVEQIDTFLDANPLGDPDSGCLLHTEIMRQHLLAGPGPGGWALTGLFDFEPAMTGPAEYEFASVGLFVSCGDRDVFSRVLAGCGLAPSPARSRRFLAYALLHRYGNLPWYLERMPPPPGRDRLEDLADLWWGCAGDPP